MACSGGKGGVEGGVGVGKELKEVWVRRGLLVLSVRYRSAMKLQLSI